MERNNKNIKVGGIKAWFLASRPKTLTGAIAPVLIGGALGWKDMHDVSVFAPFAICLLFAILMQIDANFVNDWWDFKKGTDREDRLGPERACAQGWITVGAMKVGIVITTLLSCIIGLLLLYYHQQWELVAVGMACVLGCFLYTLKLSYLGFGDLLVLIFFGIVPVGFTYYVMTDGQWTLDVTLAGIGMGLITDCLLMVNNYRDYAQDKISGKRTLIVRFGRQFGLRAYLVLGLIACALLICVCPLTGWLAAVLVGGLIYLIYNKMCKLEGRALNQVLGQTALALFLYGFTFALLIVIDAII